MNKGGFSWKRLLGITKMSEKNKEYFTGTVSEVEARCFEPCENCH